MLQLYQSFSRPPCSDGLSLASMASSITSRVTLPSTLARSWRNVPCRWPRARSSLIVGVFAVRGWFGSNTP